MLPTIGKNFAAQILSNPSWDVILVLIILAVGFFYGLTVGRRKIISTIIYTYVSLALVPVLFTEGVLKFFGEKNLFWAKTGLFLGTFLILVFLLGNRGGRKMFSISRWWEVFLLSFIQAGLLVHIILNFLPTQDIKSLGPLTRSVFANPDYHIFWLLGPLVFLVFFRWIEGRE